jgi:hypothetical protein
MKVDKRLVGLFVVFLIVLIIRLYFAFLNPYFSTEESYLGYGIIQEMVGEQSIPFFDELSYGGRSLLYSPVFFLVYSLLSLGSIFIMKVLTEVCFASMVFIVFAIAQKFTSDYRIALISTIFTNFIPIFLLNTINVISAYAFVIPLMFLMFYSLMNLNDNKYIWVFIIGSIILPLLHPSSFLFLLTILFFFFLLGGGAVQPTKKKKELLMLSAFVIILMNLIIYKKALLSHGLGVVWQNLPLSILSGAFRLLESFELLFSLGSVVIIFGIFGLYFGVLNEKNRNVYLIGAFMLSVLLLLLLQFIPFLDGLVFLGLSLGVLSSISLNRLWIYASQLKHKFVSGFIKFVILIVLPLFVIITALTFVMDNQGLQPETVEDFISIRDFEGDTVAANLHEGHLITTFTNKQNIADTNFLLAPKPVQRVKDLNLLLSTGSKASAYSIINKYGVDVIYFSEESKKMFKSDGLRYAEENECFERKGNIYLVKCTQ